MTANDEVRIDPVRRPPTHGTTRPPQHPNHDLTNIDGWTILGLVITGQITPEQAQKINGKRLRHIHAANKKAAA